MFEPKPMDSQALRTMSKKRTTNFREDETKLLIQLWGSPQVQNKLYLTHRKAPVMRLLAANMQERGFYRTPDEIKTRIRNLKCLYHRIKRSMQTGAGIGTVDPDWPHFKAMDEILSKKNQNKIHLYKDNILEGPRCEDIKQEVIDDIDINDDMESYTTNTSMNESDTEFDEEATNMATLTPSRLIDNKPKEDQEPIKIAPKPPPIPQPKMIPSNLQIPIQGVRPGNGATPTIPFPLLILNGVPNAAAMSSGLNIGQNSIKKDNQGGNGMGFNQQDLTGILKNILDVQKENLEVDKQRLELDRQKLEFQRMVGSQILTLLPMFGGLLQRMTVLNHTESQGNSADTPKKNERKRPCSDSGLDILKDSKILRNVLEQGIKKYMLGENDSEKGDNDGESENSDSNSK